MLWTVFLSRRPMKKEVLLVWLGTGCLPQASSLALITLPQSAELLLALPEPARSSGSILRRAVALPACGFPILGRRTEPRFVDLARSWCKSRFIPTYGSRVRQVAAKSRGAFVYQALFATSRRECCIKGISGSNGLLPCLPQAARLTPYKLDILMRRSFFAAGFSLLALCASLAPAQTTHISAVSSFSFPLAQSQSSSAEASPVEWSFTPSQTSAGASTANPAAASPNPLVQSGEPICGISHLVRCFEDLGKDDEGIFSSPFHIKPRDAYWLTPLGASTGLAFAYDRDAEQAAGVDPNRTRIADDIANFGSYYATGLGGAGVYFLGLADKNPKLAETGRLVAEAVIDSATVTAALKMVSNRQRPLQGNGHGDFWADGTNHWEFDSSFPSDHASSSMAMARVVSGEYPHWYVMVPAYGFVEAVSISRLLANQHFPSDIVVGQAVGFLTATYVLNHHALYRPGKKGLVNRLLSTVTPVANAQSRTFGASMRIPITIFQGR